MAERIDRWKKVEGLESPGLYVMAADPNDRTPDCTPLLWGGRPTDNVEGLVPDFERGLTEKLLAEFPRLVQVHLLEGNRIKRTKLRASYLECGFYALGREYYHFFASAIGERNCCQKIELNDVDRQFIGDGRRFTSAAKPRNGGIEGHIDSFCGKSGEDEISYWRGRWVVKGEKPGSLVEATRDYVNGVVTKFSVPVWQEVNSVGK